MHPCCPTSQPSVLVTRCICRSMEPLAINLTPPWVPLCTYTTCVPPARTPLSSPQIPHCTCAPQPAYHQALPPHTRLHVPLCQHPITLTLPSPITHECAPLCAHFVHHCLRTLNSIARASHSTHIYVPCCTFALNLAAHTSGTPLHTLSHGARIPQQADAVPHCTRSALHSHPTACTLHFPRPLLQARTSPTPPTQHPTALRSLTPRTSHIPRPRGTHRRAAAARGEGGVARAAGAGGGGVAVGAAAPARRPAAPCHRAGCRGARAASSPAAQGRP